MSINETKPNTRRKLGLMGGTFDPVHNGHLLIANEAGWRLELDAVLFIPTGDPPHKQNLNITPARRRLEMVRLATQDNPLFEVSPIEIERPGLSYTAQTLQALHEDYGEETDFYFIIGVDAAAELLSWNEPDQVVTLAKLVVVNRPGFDLPLAKLQAGLPQIDLNEHLILLDVPLVEISSTEIRHRVSQHISIRYLLPEEVIAYIEREKIYLPQAALPVADGEAQIHAH
ncbi:MAG: nicotinate-nucleotide adenylyltransferase [Chloroflexi bacterium]|nr:nicotinate-nucleotide adenylyltransferase [Chloroflexota bacterium]OJV91284.1 MAG: nicotinate (nicotinamide) nucleotide adenylyltransferase [Chloroflexi bacterium 54-19]